MTTLDPFKQSQTLALHVPQQNWKINDTIPLVNTCDKKAFVPNRSELITITWQRNFVSTGHKISREKNIADFLSHIERQAPCFAHNSFAMIDNFMEIFIEMKFELHINIDNYKQTISV